MIYDKKEAAPQSWLAGAHGVNDLFSGFLNPIMPFIAAQAGITMATATVILSIAHICSSILQPAFGYFADRARSRALLFWGLIFTSVFVPLAAASDTITALLVFIILGSLGSSFFHPQALGLVTTFTTSNRVRNMGIFMAVGTLGFAIGPLVSGTIAQYVGLDKMPVLSILGIVWALLMFAMVPAFEKSAKRPSFRLSDAVAAVAKNRQLNLLIVISMLKSLMTNSCSIILPFQWKAMGYSQTQIGVALFVFILVGSLASILSSRLEKRIGTRNVFYFSLVGTLPLMGLYWLTYDTLPALSFVIFAAIGFVTTFATPVTMSLAQSVLPQYKSIIGGFINGFSWGVVAVILTVVASVAQRTDIVTVLFVISFIPAVASLLVRKLNTDIPH